MNLYRSAALALDHLDKHKGSVKGSLAAAKLDGTPAETKRVLALIIETLKYRDVITSLLTTVPLERLERETFRKKSTPSSANFLTVLLHDLLIKGKIEASDKWAPKQAVGRHQARLKAELVRLQIRAGKSSIKELGRSGSIVQARYVRWNPNAGTRAAKGDDWSLDALHEHLATRGFELIDEPTYPVPNKQYFMDPHLPDNLLVFPPASTWWVGDKWYASGAVILQDKASCIPAMVIMDGWQGGADGLDGSTEDAECIDATAAPGNKTSLMSALMHNKGTLHAFERSPVRYKTLTRMLGIAKCTNIIPTRGDFTETNPADYPRVTRILLDPSCSGSGIVNRLDYLVENEDENDKDDEAERLDKLAGFQLQMILHAFKFPAVRRIVYSTCSIHAEEDERVVAGALAAGKGEWRLAPRSTVLPTWERRGLKEELPEGHDSVIRCMPEDKTNGFFVSCFERVGVDEERVVVPKGKKGKAAATAAAKGKGKQAQANEVKVEAPKAKAAAKDSKKRAREDDDEDADADEEPAADADADAEMADAADKETKEKTAAQMERSRRKKKLQKMKKKASA